MARKHTGIIILLFVVMFLSTFGNTASALLNTDVDYDAASGRALLISLAAVGISSLIMMAVPFIVRLAKNNKLPYQSGKQLCMWNSIILYMLSAVSIAITGASFVGGVGAIMFYFINKWLFVSDPPQQPQQSGFTSVSNTNTQQAVNVRVSAENECLRIDTDHNAHSSDATLNKEVKMTKPMPAQPYVHPIVPPENTTPIVGKQTVRYCSRCGQVIDTFTKKCTGCGKQYFKGVPWKTILVILLCVLLVASIVGNVYLVATCVDIRKEANNLSTENKELKYDIAELRGRITDLNNDLLNLNQTNNQKLDLLDSWIVFIENDGTQYYHKYECSKFIGNDCWAHNIEYAEYLGYRPCPICCH